MILGVGYGSMLTQVLKPFSCKYFRLAILSKYGAEPGSFSFRYFSSNEIRVIPYSFEGRVCFNYFGNNPLVKAVQTIPFSLHLSIISILICEISG